MDENDKNVIRTRLQNLVSSIDDFDSLLTWSVESGLFTKVMIEDFKVPGESKHELITRYFLAVTKRGPAAFGRLNACLIRSKHWDASKILQSKSEDLTDSARCPSQQRQTTELSFNTPIEKVVIQPAVDFCGGSGCVNAYKMTSTPRGFALVFVNNSFDDAAQYPSRVGADEDWRLIRELFEGLGYKVDPHFNTTKKEMKEIITSYTCKRELEFVDSFVVAVSSHGELQGIVCKDCKMLNVETELFNQFNNENCTLLKTKPKMFFIQACRGDEHDGGVALDRADSRSYPNPTKAPKVYMPTVTDMLIFYATQSGNVAFLNERHGSWFFNTITSVFMENAWKDDLQHMLTEVHRRLNQLRATIDGEKQSGEMIYRGWEKLLYFNPGL